MSDFSEIKIEMSLQGAHRLIDLIELDAFPAKAFEDGRGASDADFKRTVWDLVKTDGTSTNVVAPK